MKKVLFSLFVLSMVCVKSFAFGGHDRINRLLDLARAEMESFENEKDIAKAKKLCPVISMNLAYLQNCIAQKLSRLEERLAQYQDNLQNAEDEYDRPIWEKKIEHVQGKIQTLQKIMQTIDLWKAKLVQCC